MMHTIKQTACGIVVSIDPSLLVQSTSVQLCYQFLLQGRYTSMLKFAIIVKSQTKIRERDLTITKE